MWVKVLLFYIIISFVNDNLLLIFKAATYDKLTFEILCVYTVVEYSLFAYFLWAIIDYKIFKNIILFLTLFFFAFALTIFLSSKKQRFDSLTASLESILIICYCIFYLFDQLNKPQVMFIYQDQNFWFVAGFMVYLSAVLFLFIEASNLEQEERDSLWQILFVANIAKNVLFAVGFSIKGSKNHLLPVESIIDEKIFENPYET